MSLFSALVLFLLCTFINVNQLFVILLTDNVDFRHDGKCGPDYLAPNGLEATCPGECCSTDGECGSTREHCLTKLYKNYQGNNDLCKLALIVNATVMRK